MFDRNYIIETFESAHEAGGIIPDDARKFAIRVFDIIEPLLAFDAGWAGIPVVIQQIHDF